MVFFYWLCKKHITVIETRRLSHYASKSVERSLLWPWRRSKKVTSIKMYTGVQIGYLPSPRSWTDHHQNWHGVSCGRRNQVCQKPSLFFHDSLCGRHWQHPENPIGPNNGCKFCLAQFGNKSSATAELARDADNVHFSVDNVRRT